MNPFAISPVYSVRAYVVLL